MPKIETEKIVTYWFTVIDLAITCTSLIIFILACTRSLQQTTSISTAFQTSSYATIKYIHWHIA